MSLRKGNRSDASLSLAGSFSSGLDRCIGIAALQPPNATEMEPHQKILGPFKNPCGVTQCAPQLLERSDMGSRVGNDLPGRNPGQTGVPRSRTRLKDVMCTRPGPGRYILFVKFAEATCIDRYQQCKE